MELRLLRYFLAVAQEESISAAAEYLHLTQPTLSRQMIALEEELGKPLFIRGKRRISLTQDGMRLRKRANEILELADKTQAEFRNTEETVAGDVYIGAGETDAMRLIARTSGILQQQYPDLRFHIFSGDRVDVVEHLEKGLIDFALLVGEVDSKKYDTLLLPVRDSWSVLMPKDHPLAKQEAIRPQDLWDQPLTLSRQMRDGSPLLNWMGKPLSQLHVVSTHNLIYNASLMVEEGFSLAVTLDKLINTTGESRLCYRPLEPRLEVEVHLVWKKHQVMSKAVEAFLNQFQKDLQVSADE